MTSHAEISGPPDTLLDSRVVSDHRATGLLDRLVEIYMESATSLIATIEGALAGGDTDQVRMAAHSLKSASGSIGLPYFAELCGRLEVAARAGAGDECRRDLPQFLATYAQAIDELRALRE